MMSKAQAVTLKLSLMSRDCLAPWMTALPGRCLQLGGWMVLDL